MPGLGEERQRSLVFIDRTCVNHYRSTGGGEVICGTVHLGMAGEGQELRHPLKGTGLNAAGHPSLGLSGAAFR